MRPGTVVRIAADTVPFSETPVPSEQPIRAVLEVNAGTAERLGIEPGRQGAASDLRRQVRLAWIEAKALI